MNAPGDARARGIADPTRAEAFRIWLRDQVERDLRGPRAIEGEAGLPEGSLVRFLGGGSPRHGLTAPMVARLAGALREDQAELLVRTGHTASEPCAVPLDEVILARADLDRESKLLLIALAVRLSTARPGAPPRYSTDADRRAARGEAVRRLVDQGRRRPGTRSGKPHGPFE